MGFFPMENVSENEKKMFEICPQKNLAFNEKLESKTLWLTAKIFQFRNAAIMPYVICS